MSLDCLLLPTQAVAYHHFLNMTVFSNPVYAGYFTKDFAFYFEAPDAFRVHPSARLLQLPVLVNSRHPTSRMHDSYSIPVPDTYMTYGLYKYLGGPAVRGRDGFHGDAWRIFAFNLTFPKWEDKKPAPVWRGSAWGTGKTAYISG